MSISICIATYNRFPHLKNCLNSIFNGFGDYPYEIIIADGGSTDGTIEYLKDLDNVKLIELGELTGAVKAFNKCFKAVKGDYIFPVADDSSLISDVAIKSCKLMDKEEQISLVIPKVYEPEFGHLNRVSLPKRFYWLLWGKTFIFRASALKEINYFDEAYRTYNVEDDSSFSILKLGYTSIFTKDIGVIHYRADDADKNKARAANFDEHKVNNEGKYFRKKWEPLMMEVEKYLQNFPLTRHKAIFFRRCSATMFYAKWLKPFVKINDKASIKMYDWLMERSIVFKDKNYSHMKDFFLAQKLPDDVLSALN